MSYLESNIVVSLSDSKSKWDTEAQLEYPRTGETTVSSPRAAWFPSADLLQAGRARFYRFCFRF